MTAKDGDYSEVLIPYAPNGERCSYQGALERKGTYSLTVNAAGRTTTVQDVRIRADECHVIPVSLTVTIQTQMRAPTP